MVSKSVHSPESTNTLSKFITVYFQSESQGYEATIAGSNTSEGTNSLNALRNDQLIDNNISQKNLINKNILFTHISPDTSSNNQLEPENQMPQIPQPTPQPKPIHLMITRAKTGIFKSKIYSTEKSLSL